MAETTKNAVKEKQPDATQQGKKTEQKIRSLTEKYKAQPKKTVSISPMYKPYFSNALHVAINTKVVVVLCDGKSYSVPAVFADRINQMIHDVDNFIMKRGRMEDISANIESSPGELTFF